MRSWEKKWAVGLTQDWTLFLKYLSKDGIIKTILHIDPNSVANFGYDVVTGTIKSIKSAGKLGNTIADLAVG